MRLNLAALALLVSMSVATAYVGWRPSEAEKNALVARGMADIAQWGETSMAPPQNGEECIVTALRRGWQTQNPDPDFCRDGGVSIRVK